MFRSDKLEWGQLAWAKTRRHIDNARLWNGQERNGRIGEFTELPCFPQVSCILYKNGNSL